MALAVIGRDGEAQSHLARAEAALRAFRMPTTTHIARSKWPWRIFMRREATRAAPRGFAPSCLSRMRSRTTFA
jgi:hypothetical protein